MSFQRFSKSWGKFLKRYCDLGDYLFVILYIDIFNSVQLQCPKSSRLNMIIVIKVSTGNQT